MRFSSAIGLAAAFACQGAGAAEVTYTKDIAPILREMCSECHGVGSPDLQTFLRNEKKYADDRTGPRLSTYAEVVGVIVWPETGALMRRLDDGKATADGKPGSMYRRLGLNEAERQKNLALFKAWIGEGGWNLNRWTAQGAVPAITKEQLDRFRLAY